MKDEFDLSDRFVLLFLHGALCVFVMGVMLDAFTRLAIVNGIVALIGFLALGELFRRHAIAWKRDLLDARYNARLKLRPSREFDYSMPRIPDSARTLVSGISPEVFAARERPTMASSKMMWQVGSARWTNVSALAFQDYSRQSGVPLCAPSPREDI